MTNEGIVKYMTEVLLHSSTRASIEQLLARPAHAVLLIAPNGAGKGTTAQYLAGRMLDVEVEKLGSSAFFKSLAAKPGKALSIEEVRDVTHYLMLKSARQ